MIEIAAKTVLLDIEGTVSPISYVHDVLFPFARKNTRSYLERCWENTNTLEACDLLAREAGFESSFHWLQNEEKQSDMIDKVMELVNRLMDEDSKTIGLKALQGFVWAEAYGSGLLRSQVFVDLPQALASWKATGLTIAIYSSGSATAQRDFFTHTEYGDLSDYFAAYFDTSCGPKKESQSYSRIAKILSQEVGDMVFFSDTLAELEAAKEAGLNTVLMKREGNAEENKNGHLELASFYDLRIIQEQEPESN